LRRLISESGSLGVTPVLRAVVSTPRDDVMDEAAAVLGSAADRDDDVANLLVNVLAQPPAASTLTADPACREVVLRAIVRSRKSITIQNRTRLAYRLAKSDGSASVRDAAVQAMSTMGELEGADVLIVCLEALRAEERSALVLESIDEAISNLRDH
jgi:hypothetical protein